MKQMLIHEFLPVAEEFELDSLNEDFTEEMIFEALAYRINELLDAGRLEYLLNLLYRHDVDERLIWKALDPKSPLLPNLAIAALLIERFKKKMLTRQKYKTPPVKDWLKFDD